MQIFQARLSLQVHLIIDELRKRNSKFLVVFHKDFQSLSLWDTRFRAQHGERIVATHKTAPTHYELMTECIKVLDKNKVTITWDA